MLLSRRVTRAQPFAFARFLHATRPMGCDMFPPKMRVQLKKLDIQLNKLPNSIRTPVTVLVKATFGTFIVCGALSYAFSGAFSIVIFLMTTNPLPFVGFVFTTFVIGVASGFDVW